MMENDPITDLINRAVEKQPVEFETAFDSAMQDRLRDLVDLKKLELAQSMFGGPEDEETPEIADEEPEFDDLEDFEDEEDEIEDLPQEDETEE